MSLIADALKRAQEQRQAGRPDDPARRMLSGAGPLRVETGDGGRVTRPVALAVLAVVVAAGVFVSAVVLAPGGVGGGTEGTEGTEEAEGTEVGVRVAGADTGELPGTGLGRGTDSGTGTGTGSGMGTDLGTGTGELPGAGAGTDWGTGELPGAQAGTASGERLGTGTRTHTGTGTGRGEDAEPAEGAEAEGGSVAAASSFRLSVSGAQSERTGDQLYGLALGAHRAGELDRAVSLYRSAIEAAPGDPQLWNNLGVVYRRLSMPGQALAAFRSAVAADAGYAPAWSNLGLMLEGLGREGEAVEAYREALRHDPGNVGAKVNLANRYQAMGLPGEARSLLTEALGADPAIPEAHYALARLLEEAGEVDGAVRHYRLFLDFGGDEFPELSERVVRHLGEMDGGGS